ncbi:MAG TPA: substrate-binding domain-containing protein [Paenibacillus sp.]|uniref:substrate-binding domain-containing protein n=1 Tax=Paenibacillus sp. TaxID=58172 RepID=UPI0028D03C2A|nr:substrate-binding domain-containing protein [Paenibacillus sp.]HUC91086.1 substrate-binding domain-containing protein [Paenibacillus sp.]
MSNRKWNLGIVLLFLLFVFLLLQFLFSTLRIRELVHPQNAAGNGQDPAAYVVLISQELDNPFWRSLEQGARDASRRYGFHLEYIGPFRINPGEQIRLLEKSIAAKPDAILLQGINDPSYRELIDEAVSQGIAVIAVDTDEPGSRRLAYVGTDNLAAGKKMGELVAQAARGQGGIGVLIGTEQAENQRLRLAGFRAVIDEYPGLSVVDVRSSEISRLQAAQEAEDILTRYPRVRYMVGFSSLDGVGILEAAGRMNRQDVRIYAFDDVADTVEAIAGCRIESSIVQYPYEMGYQAVSLFSGYKEGRQPQPQHFTAIKVLDRGATGTGNGNGERCP